MVGTNPKTLFAITLISFLVCVGCPGGNNDEEPEVHPIIGEWIVTLDGYAPGTSYTFYENGKYFSWDGDSQLWGEYYVDDADLVHAEYYESWNVGGYTVSIRERMIIEVIEDEVSGDTLEGSYNLRECSAGNCINANFDLAGYRASDFLPK